MTKPILLCVLAAFAAAACSGDAGSPAASGGRAVKLVLTPHDVSLPPGGTQRFSAVETMSGGGQAAAEASFTVTGGSIDAEGVYTAPAAAGTYGVVGHDGELYDTATVVVTAAAVQRVTISPAGAQVQAGGTVQFAASAHYSDGHDAAVTPAWSATGGTITAAGLYTAGAAAGTFQVIATVPGAADTASVTVTTAPPPALTALSVSPSTATLAPGGTAQFTATGTFAGGGTGPVAVTWTATGGSISASGVYTAGATAGTYRVTASASGLSAGADVTIAAAPPPPPPPSGNYVPVFSENWHSYTSKAALQAAQYFWWFDAAGRNVYDYVDLVQDPTFGQVARITFPQNSGSPGSSPRITRALPAPLGDFWYRFRMKYQPGWTTVGPDPAGSANSYKVAFFTWETGFGSRGELELSNSTEYITGVGVTNSAGSYLQYNETLLPGSAPSFGTVGTEWSDGEWWEYVIHYRKTGSNSALYQYYRRRLTSNGSVAPGGWTYFGMSMSGDATPRVASVDLGCNKNKNNPSTMYIYWGQWEVVDGSKYPNPFSVPNAQ